MPELDEQVLSLEIKAAKLTFDMVRRAIAAVVSKKDRITYGRQSVAQLNRHGQSLEMIDLPEIDAKNFRKELRRHGVDYAIMRDKANNSYRLFFKARDADRIHYALEQYVTKAFTPELPRKLVQKSLQAAIQRSEQHTHTPQLQQKELVQQHGAR